MMSQSPAEPSAAQPLTVAALDDGGNAVDQRRSAEPGLLAS
jgi:hypothetical protein